MSAPQIRSFQPGDEVAFRTLNEAWISRLFRLEDKDRATLGDPQRYVLEPGGRILMAILDGVAVGCCALLKPPGTTVELAKMAVDLEHQGRGLGRLLMTAAIEEARRMGATSVYLETNSTLAPAIALYRAFGFRLLSKEQARPSTFARADVPMQLDL